MANIIFYIKTCNPNKHGLKPLLAQLSQGKIRVRKQLFFINPELWDTKNQRIKTDNLTSNELKKYTEYNSTIETLNSKALSLFNKVLLKKRKATEREIQRIFYTDSQIAKLSKKNLFQKKVDIGILLKEFDSLLQNGDDEQMIFYSDQIPHVINRLTLVSDQHHEIKLKEEEKKQGYEQLLSDFEFFSGTLRFTLEKYKIAEHLVNSFLGILKFYLDEDSYKQIEDYYLKYEKLRDSDTKQFFSQWDKK